MARKHINILSGRLFIFGCLGLLIVTHARAQFTGSMQTFTISGSTTEPEVRLLGFPKGPVISDQSGYYSVEVPFGWSNTVKPEKTGYVFDPPSIRYESVQTDMTEQNYQSRLLTFTISGTVNIGQAILDGFPEGPITADESGRYKAIVSYGWSGEVTPIKDGYSFVPPRRSYNPVTRDMTNESYRAERKKIEISGTVIVNGNPLAGVIIQGLPGNPATRSDGSYSTTVDYGWSGTVTPQKEGYTFEPPMQSYSDLSMPMTNEVYYGTAIQYTISGNVGIEGVIMRGLNNVVSGPDGRYEAMIDYGFSQKVTPYYEGYKFDPEARTYRNVREDMLSENYQPEEIFLKISGNVYEGGVMLEGLLDPDGGPVVSDERGRYSTTVRYGWQGNVRPRKDGYLFKPESKFYSSVTGNLINETYRAERIRYEISGNVGEVGVLMKGFPGRIVSDRQGNYSAQVEHNWSGSVTPEKGGWQFDPPSLNFSGVMEPKVEQNFLATPKEYTISGRILSDEGPVEGVSVFTEIGSPINDVTDFDGNFTLTVPYDWSGRIQLVMEGYVFKPPTQRIDRVRRDMTFNFSASVRMFKIIGEIIIGGQPIPGVTITATNGGTTAITDARGRYTVEVPYNWTGEIVPTKAGFEFNPPSKPYENVKSDIDETSPDVSIPSTTPDYAPPAMDDMGMPSTQPSATESIPSAFPDESGVGMGQPQLLPPQTMGFSPDRELIQAQINQLQQQLNALRGGDQTDMMPEGDLREIIPDASSVLPDEQKGPLVINQYEQEDLRVILSEIAADTEQSIMMDQEVGGFVSCRLDGVPLETALDIVLAGTGYTWKKTPYYYLVSSSNLKSPSFAQASETRRVKMAYVDAEVAASLLSTPFQEYVKAERGEGGRVVMVTAPRHLMDRIIQDLKELDERPRQVMLDARIVVMERGDLLNLGVEWGWPTITTGVFGQDGQGGTGGATAATSVYEYGGRFPWGIQIGYSPDHTFTNALEMQLNLLIENGEARIASNPQVMAQDGKEAQIRVTTEEYFMMTPPDVGLGFYSRAELQDITSGTTLTITPYISDNNDIVLEMTTELSDSIPRGRGSDLPVVTRRTTSNTVIVKDGGTVAIAGLSQNNRKIKHKKVPGLGDIPMIGALFNNNEDDKAQREVAVFVTARLISERGALGRLGARQPQQQIPDYVNPASAAGLGGTSSASREDFRSSLYESIRRNRSQRR